jgi:hypothetical protein
VLSPYAGASTPVSETSSFLIDGNVYADFKKGLNVSNGTGDARTRNFFVNPLRSLQGHLDTFHSQFRHLFGPLCRDQGAIGENVSVWLQ